MTQPTCTAEGTFALPFAPLDNHGKSIWTMNFDEQPVMSLTEAQLAGLFEDCVTPLPLDDRAAELEQQNVAVLPLRHLEHALAHQLQMEQARILSGLNVALGNPRAILRLRFVPMSDRS